MRAIALVLLLVFPAVAGCLGGDEGPRLAVPTDAPIIVPTPTVTRTPTVTYNFSDPGYRMTAPWRAGDGWDYESNESHYRRVRVIDSRLIDGRSWYIVEERVGKLKMPAERVTTLWVTGRDWLQVNATDDLGGRDNYTPGIPQRSFKNGSFTYEHTRTESSGRKSIDENVSVATRLRPLHESLLFSWGYVEAKRVDHTIVTRAGLTRTESNVTHWVHTDYLNDVQYRLANGEVFKLVAVKAGNFRRGSLV